LPRVSLATLTSGRTDVATLNANFAAIQAALDLLLSRTGEAPNSMEANLDMNSNHILNLPAPAGSNEPARLRDVQDASIVTQLPSQTGNNGKVLHTDGSAAFWDTPTTAIGDGDVEKESLSEDLQEELGLTTSDYSYPIDNIVPNGDFTLWTARPASGSVTTAGSGVGFAEIGTICDGWYGGPGPTSQYTFTNPIDSTATAARQAVFTWNASVSAGETQHDVVGQISSGYWRFSFLEYITHIAPEYFAGQTITIQFDAKIGSTVNAAKLVPIAWISMGMQTWAANTAYYVGDERLNGSSGELGGGRIYRCTTAGTSAGSGGPSGTGSGISDNTAVWTYVGEQKGREYELYEQGADATTQQIAWGDPHTNARITLGTTYSTYTHRIYIPALNEGTGSRYSGQANDNGSRVFSMPQGLGAYFGIGFDLWHNAATGPTISLRNVRVWVGDGDQPKPIKVPRDVAMLMSNGFSRMADLYRPIASQAQQEAGTSTTAGVTSGRQHYHPSAAKFWLEWATTGTTIAASYNVTSVTNTGTGNETVVIGNDFSGASWACIPGANTANSGDATESRHVAYGNKGAGSVQILITNGANPEAFADASLCSVAGFGDL
jgi:hypothetical protein